jgi:hypothetical protein
MDSNIDMDYSNLNTVGDYDYSDDFKLRKYKKLYLIKEEIDKLVEKLPFESFKTVSNPDDCCGYRVLGKIPMSSYEINIKFKCSEEAFLGNFSGLLLGNIGLVLIEDVGYDIYSSDPDIILEPLSDLMGEIVKVNADREGLYNDRLFDSDKFWSDFDLSNLKDTLKKFSWDDFITTTTTNTGITGITSTLTTGDACCSVVDKSNTLPVTKFSDNVLSDEMNNINN